MTKTKLSLLAFIVLSQANAANINLEKLTVSTPTKSSQSLENITANVDVITSDEIKDRGYKTILDALKARAGIVYTRNGGVGKSTSVMLRGISQKRTLVLVDGVRYNDPASISGAHLQHILMDNIDRIEIVKGAQSGVWGADASAGVINIITKKATKDGLSASVHGEYGSFNTQTFGFDTYYKQDKFDISLNAQRLSTDGFTTKVPLGKDKADFEDDQYENNSADIKLGYNVTPNDKIETFFNYIDSDSDFDGYNKDADKAANDPLSNSSAKQKFYGISYTNTEGKNKSKLYYNQSDFSRVSKSGARESKFDGTVREFGLNSSLSYTKDADFSIGFDCKKFRHKNKIDKVYANQGIFLTNSNKFTDLGFGNIIFSQALRYDKFDDFKNKITYKVGAKISPQKVEDLWFSTNYGTAYNVPSLSQLYSYAGNKNLNPEETKSFDITASFKNIGITYFHNEIDDMIEYVTTDFKTFAGSYFNVAGKSTLKGVELTYSGELEVANLAYNLNYTYLKTEDKKGKELPRRAKNSANLSLDYYALENSHVGATVGYVGGRKKSKYDKNSKVDYDAYTVIDMIADYDVTPELNVYAKVDNVLDKEYETITGYATSQRAYYLGFRYKIK